ncbi:carboxylate--amine ligase [Anaerotardibacter muris]|uniref:carboxylate--amine ligase n=1 Tax=Anaerotardibacter muris TaxID=2941505 RepID=UPI00203CA0A0|nr:carboxylate--amine ligase [Anaerotardibacter muris]
MLSDDKLTQEYFDTMNALDGDAEGRAAAQAYMDASSAIVHHRVVGSTFVPRLYNDVVWERFRYVAETTHTILCKVIERYRSDEDYRQIFDYDPRLVELALLPRGYDAVLPFARLDIFLDENTLESAFCEINGDGSAGLNEDREIVHSIEQSATFRSFAEQHTLASCELFETWVQEFIRIYNTFDHKVDNPRFAICDYLDVGVVDEFRIFSDYFKAAGYECVVADVRDLYFDGTDLCDSEGRVINAIWRRSVTNDVIEHWDESQDLINAVREGAVALIGAFSGHIIHDKQIFEALRNPLTKAFLTEEENAFIESQVPATYFLADDDCDLEAVRANKDAWIIKPTDSYGARDVYAGIACSQSEWDHLIDRYANGAAGAPFLVQRYITPFKTLTLPPDSDIPWLVEHGFMEEPVPGEPIKGVPYNNISGLYLFNGTFTGVFSRLGPLPAISKEHKGITAATIRVLDRA